MQADISLQNRKHLKSEVARFNKIFLCINHILLCYIFRTSCVGRGVFSKSILYKADKTRLHANASGIEEEGNRNDIVIITGHKIETIVVQYSFGCDNFRRCCAAYYAIQTTTTNNIETNRSKQRKKDGKLVRRIANLINGERVFYVD